MKILIRESGGDTNTILSVFECRNSGGGTFAGSLNQE